jgi:RNA polymerase sigma factor (sigma-70 family)
MKPPENEEHTRHSFDSYCKRILKRKAIDCHRETKRLGEHETPFSDLPEQELMGIAATDKYFADKHVFNVRGEDIGVSDYGLGEALSGLPADRREIVLMSYFFDMTDKEIAGHMNMARRTVAYRRAAILRELKKLMERED